MKTTTLTPALLLGLALGAAAPAALAQENPAAPAPARGAAPTIKFNFRGAPLETVLNYMSEAAGFVIVLETPVRGTIDMWSAQPVTREEAVQLLNFALNKNGYAATQQGRSLIVSSKEDAKKRNIPIRTGNDPQEIPENAEMVMQIIPLRRLDATQAARDLATLLPNSANITASADSNSLVVTDTQINVRHIVELVAALDGSSDTVSTMRVFKLANADPVEMAQLLTSLYAPVSAAGRGGPTGGGGFAGFGGGFPGFGPGGFAAAAAAAAQGGRGGGTTGGRGSTTGGRSGRTGGGAATSTGRSTPVVAVADPRTYSVIVTASKEDMAGIAEVVAQLDSSSARKQKVFVYTMENADVKQVETVLRNLFPSANTRTTTNQQVDPLQSRANANAQQTGSSTGFGGLGTGGTGGRGGGGN
jgi:type II secretory pathway component GspD/PulD (secretin)